MLVEQKLAEQNGASKDTKASDLRPTKKNHRANDFLKSRHELHMFVSTIDLGTERMNPPTTSSRVLVTCEKQSCPKMPPLPNGNH